MRGLVFVPQSRVYRESIEAIARQQYAGGLDFFFARGGDDPAAHPYDNHLRKCRQAREIALRDGYDFMLSIEDDIIPPADALPRLLALNADVAYGLVCARHEPYFWGTAVRVEGDSIYEETPHKTWGKTIPVVGCGLYCTLICRSVLEALDFHRDTRNACDWDFSLDCQRLGVNQMADQSVICGHVMTDGRVVWPDPKTGYRMEAA